jgi:hypothetical protein
MGVGISFSKSCCCSRFQWHFCPCEMMGKPSGIVFFGSRSNCSTLNLKMLWFDAIRSCTCGGHNMWWPTMNKSINSYISLLKHIRTCLLLWSKILTPYVVSCNQRLMHLKSLYIAPQLSLHASLFLGNGECPLAFTKSTIFYHLHFTCLNWYFKSTISSLAMYSSCFAWINAITSWCFQFRCQDFLMFNLLELDSTLNTIVFICFWIFPPFPLCDG